MMLIINVEYSKKLVNLHHKKQLMLHLKLY